MLELRRALRQMSAEGVDVREEEEEEGVRVWRELTHVVFECFNVPTDIHMCGR